MNSFAHLGQSSTPLLKFCACTKIMRGGLGHDNQTTKGNTTTNLILVVKEYYRRRIQMMKSTTATTPTPPHELPTGCQSGWQPHVSVSVQKSTSEQILDFFCFVLFLVFVRFIVFSWFVGFLFFFLIFWFCGLESLYKLLAVARVGTEPMDNPGSWNRK